MILSNKQITKALIRLRRCADWYAPVLLANPKDRFSRDKAHMITDSLDNTEKLLRVMESPSTITDRVYKILAPFKST